MAGVPEVQPGGSLMVAWQLQGKHVLVVGGGQVATGRILHALNADARVTVIAPSVAPAIQHYIAAGQPVRHVQRRFEAEDLADGTDVAMVFTALDDPAQSDAIWRRCKALRIPVNVADVPEHCDFYFGSVYRDGPLQVLISTNGNGPKMANLVKARIQAAMPENTGDAIRNVGVLRRKLREVAPAPEEGPKRMRWITKICEAWTFEDLVRMDEQCMDRMLACYASGRIPLAGDEGILQEKQCA